MRRHCRRFRWDGGDCYILEADVFEYVGRVGADRYLWVSFLRFVLGFLFRGYVLDNSAAVAEHGGGLYLGDDGGLVGGEALALGLAVLQLLQLLAAHDAHLVVVLQGDVVALAGRHDLDQRGQCAPVHRHLRRLAGDLG